jgi:hypothetical protein
VEGRLWSVPVDLALALWVDAVLESRIDERGLP